MNNKLKSIAEEAGLVKKAREEAAIKDKVSNELSEEKRKKAVLAGFKAVVAKVEAETAAQNVAEEKVR